LYPTAAAVASFTSRVFAAFWRRAAASAGESEQPVNDRRGEGIFSDDIAHQPQALV
jgi:hypothetical protein